MNSLGIDVGGANLKIAARDGWEIIYFPMWKKVDQLGEVLRSVAEKYGAQKAGVVMTAELVDVFESKEKGVRKIVSTCSEIFDEVLFLDVFGNLCRDVSDPLKFAASNWVASIKFLLEEEHTNFLFVDMGSTTTDLIPVTDRIQAALTDFERLKRGELIYFGVLRTPVFYVLEEYDSAPLCPEYFSITADVFVVTGDISYAEYTCETPDGGGKDRRSCLKRLARTVCCDLNELGESNAARIAFEAKKSMVERLASGIERKIEEYGLEIVFACGIGEFLIQECCELLGVECIRLSDVYGDYSKLFPAYAMLKLVEKQ